MQDFLTSEDALDAFLSHWITGTLPEAEFTHAAHVAVCAYLAHGNQGDLFQRMKTRILHFNLSVGTPNTPDRGYHETLTRFWCALVGTLVHQGDYATKLEAARAAVATFGTDHMATDRYYSFNVLRSREARQRWIEPDLAPLPNTQSQPERSSQNRAEA